MRESAKILEVGSKPPFLFPSEEVTPMVFLKTPVVDAAAR